MAKDKDKGKDKDKEKEAGREKDGAAAGVAAGALVKEPFLSKKGWMVVGVASAAWALICIGVYVMARSDPQVVVEEEQDSAAKLVGDKNTWHGGIGPNILVLRDIQIHYRSNKDTSPFMILAASFEFSPEFWDPEQIGAKKNDLWKLLETKVEAARPKITSEVFKLVQGKDFPALEGTANANKLGEEIKTIANRILGGGGKGSQNTVRAVHFESYRFPE